MANRQPRHPGAVRQVDASARISADVPYQIVERGDMAAAVARVAGQLAGRLSHIADEAAAREGELEGLAEGQRAGEAFAERHRVEARAAEAAGLGYDLHAHLVDPNRRGDIDGSQPEFRRRLGQMLASAPIGIGDQVGLLSGYRSPERQAQLYSDALSRYGSEGEARRWVAPPGRSRHNHGDAYDLRFGSDAARDWVHANAGRFGLVFPMAHEPWHIETVEARGGTFSPPEMSGHSSTAAPEVINQSSTTAPEASGLSTEPLQLRRDGTIRGQAFDQAAMRAAGWRVDTAISAQLAQAYADHPSDPEAYAAAVAGIREQVLEGGAMNDPELAEAIERSIVERSSADMRSVLANREAALAREEQAAARGALDAGRRELERAAFNAGANGDAGAMLGPAAARHFAAIDAAVAAGTMTPLQGLEARQALETTMARAQIEGTFSALSSPARQEAFATGLLDEWAAGTGPVASLDYGQAQALSRALYNEARTAANRRSAEGLAEAARINALVEDDLASVLATGQGLDLDAAGVTADQIAEVLGEAGAREWQVRRDMASRVWDATAGMAAQGEAEIAARLEAMRPEPGQPGYTDQQAVFEAAAAAAARLLEERRADPLGQAQEAGLIELRPLDLTAEGLDASLRLRAEEARTAAFIYGTPPTAFRPGEREALAGAMLATPELLPGVAAAVVEQMGGVAGPALAELGEAGPALAHAAGLAQATGDRSVALDVARVLAGRRDRSFTASMPQSHRFASEGAAWLNGALAAAPGTQEAVVATAALLYEHEANMVGFDPAAIGREGTPAQAAWERAMTRALGGHSQGGERYGGLAEVNGGWTVAPAELRAEDVARAVRAMSAGDLALLGELATVNGTALTAGQLGRARLTAVGDGRYWLSLGDPLGPDPQFVVRADGAPAVLDIRALREHQARAAAAGGGSPVMILNPLMGY